MQLYEIFALAVGLAMDAFAVSVCKGLAMDRATLPGAAAVGAWFGGFQGIMPLLGYLMGATVAAYVDSFDHWIAFVLLLFIGGNMVREGIQSARGKESGEGTDGSLRIIPMATMAIATSIDAFAVGVTFAFEDGVNPFLAAGIIAGVTFVIAAAGVKIGSIFGGRYKAAAELAGGFILIVIGLRTLLAGL